MDKSKLSNEEKLKQLIYLGGIEGKYICGGPERHRVDTKEIEDVLQEYLKSHQDLLKIIEAANEDKLLPNRSQLFYILALFSSMKEATETVKPEINNTALKIAKSDKEIVDFVKHAMTLKLNANSSKSKFSPSIRKVIGKFYEGKTPEDLAKSYVANKSYHGWTHKDLIKYCHVKSDSPLKGIIVNYILFKKDTESELASAKELVELMKKAETLRSTKDHKIAVPLITELKATIDQVEAGLRKSAEVWNAALPNMSIMEVLQSLPKLYKRGFLKKDTPTHAQINEALTNAQKVKNSSIHPVEVFIHMKNFEKGGKPLDPKLLDHLKTEKNLTDEEVNKLKTPNEVKAPVIMSSIQKCMNISCVNNIQPLGKRYLITIDTSDKMDTPCLGCKNITSIEAAAVFAWYLLRIEKDVTVAVFKEKEVTVIHLEKKGHLYEHVQKLRENKTRYITLSAPIDWAASQKKHFDIFVNFINHPTSYINVPKEAKEKTHQPLEALNKYRKKVNLPNSKLVTFCMSIPNMVISIGTPNVLDIAGLDLSTAKVFESFCRSNFS